MRRETAAAEASPAAGAEAVTPGPAGRALEVFGVALGLGLTSFGGPIAHLGYFERAYVRERRWLTAEEYAGIVALCQMIPGPASSQTGFLIGLKRAGWPGALAAWVGFTAPSALLMFAFALLSPRLGGPAAAAALHGLKLVAVAVVAQAVWTMAGKLCPDRRRSALALGAAVLLLGWGGAGTQLLALGLGAVGGMILCRDIEAQPAPPRLPVGRKAAAAALALLLALLIGLPLAARGSGRSLAALGAVFLRAGALVFGGGHVVLPLLRDMLTPSGWIPDAQFLAGYGLAQAMPGPLFAFAAYLGAAIAQPAGGPAAAALWSATALACIFLPGLLVAVAGVPVWNAVSRHAAARGALAGINAAVVGVLGAALYAPVWVSSVAAPADVAVAATGVVLLERWRVPPVMVTAFCVAAVLAAGLLRRPG